MTKEQIKAEINYILDRNGIECAKQILSWAVATEKASAAHKTIESNAVNTLKGGVLVDYIQAQMEVDEAVLDLERGINALGAICNVMERGEFSAETHLDGLYFVYGHLFDSVKSLRREIEQTQEGWEDHDQRAG